MRRPYGGFLILSLSITVIYFLLEKKKPTSFSIWDDLPNKVLYGIIYVGLLFSIFSFVYIYGKKGR